jgi:Na+:H+ antiporter
MTDIEVIIGLILVFMAVPDLCRKLGRPALAYSFFVLFGLGLHPLVDTNVAVILIQAGKVGFLLLLFEVGLEIELPALGEFLRPLRFAVLWSLCQYPVVLLIAPVAGLSVGQALLVAAALGGCAVGMAHTGWKHYPWPEGQSRRFVLEVMVALEMLTMVLLAVEMPAVERGVRGLLVLNLVGIAAVIWLVSRFARHLERLFQRILTTTTHWRVHWLVLLVLGVCAAGERLGLSAAKTAFFLGLFMSHTRHAGLSLEEQMAPISERFLIPVFFVSLGLQIQRHRLLSLQTVLAAGTAGLLLGVREVLHRRWLPTGGDRWAFLLLCPNLTLVALAASVLLARPETATAATWLLLTGLFVTVPGVWLLPASEPAASPGIRPPPLDERSAGGRG